MMRAIAAALLLLCVVSTAGAVDQALVTQANEALAKATTYLTTRVASGGGYGGVYLPDLSDQWGEGHITRPQNWVQPPGSPSTGFAFLRAWEATGQQPYLDAAVQVAHSLVRTQLECGGWDYVVDHSPEGPRRWYYRTNRNSADPALKQGRNQATFDDDTTQHATRLLIAVDQAVQGHDAAVHEAMQAALDFMLRAQHESGGWPQRYPPAARGYGDFFTFNDNSIADCADVMVIAFKAYGDERYREAVRKCGDFIIRTQLPAPQATWAQQYDMDLRPAWARKFEPPAACGGESVGVMRLLITIALFTGEDRYLKPLPAAFDWFKRSVLPNGQWARFYELKTNRPLYFTRDTYWLTYSDADMPTHYSFKSNWNPARVEAQYTEITQKGLTQAQADREPKPLTAEQRARAAEAMEPRVREALAAQDAQGGWITTSGPNVEQGQPRLDMQTVQSRMKTLSDYLKLVNGR
ncbi:pectate lyase [bacterium]|nr:pectate lyase [bacterium]